MVMITAITKGIVTYILKYFKIVHFSPDQITHNLINDPDFISIIQKNPLHQHDFFEFMFVLEGEVVTKIENTERIYPAGTGCILNCNIRHAECFHQSFRVIFFNLSKGFVKDFLNSFRIFQFDIEKNHDKDMICQFLYSNVSSDNEIKKEYLDFFPLFQNQNSYKRVYGLAEQIFHTMLYPSFGATFLINSLLCQLFDCFSNEQYFHTTKVKIDFGTDFLLFTQMTHLLEDSNGHLQRHELAEISVMLGFSNRTHFYSIFSKKHGVTPKEFRQNAVK